MSETYYEHNLEIAEQSGSKEIVIKIARKYARMLDTKRTHFLEQYILNQTKIGLVSGEVVATDALKAWELIQNG